MKFFLILVLVGLITLLSSCVYPAQVGFKAMHDVNEQAKKEYEEGIKNTENNQTKTRSNQVIAQ